MNSGADSVNFFYFNLYCKLFDCLPDVSPFKSRFSDTSISLIFDLPTLIIFDPSVMITIEIRCVAHVIVMFEIIGGKINRSASYNPRAMTHC